MIRPKHISELVIGSLRRHISSSYKPRSPTRDAQEYVISSAGDIVKFNSTFSKENYSYNLTKFCSSFIAKPEDSYIARKHIASLIYALQFLEVVDYADAVKEILVELEI